MEAKQLQEVVARLEAVAAKLEKCGVAGPAPAAADEESEDYPEVIGYDEAFKEPLAKMEAAAKAIGQEVVDMSKFVTDMFAAIRRIVLVGCRCSKPDNNAQFAVLTKLSSDSIAALDKMYPKVKNINILKAVNECMTLLTWPTIGASAEQYAIEMTGSVQCYTNKIVREFKGKDENQVQWTQGLVKACQAIPNFINDFEKGGIKFNPRGPKATPEMFQLGAGAAAKKEEPKKEEPKKEEPKPAPKPAAGKAALLGGKLAGLGPKVAPKTPGVKRMGDLQVQIEYFTEGAPNLEEQNLKNEDILNIFACKNTEITIPTKVKAVSILNTERCIISPKDIIGTLELNGVKKTKIYLEGKVNTITCDKCDGLEIYLNKESANLQLIASLSTGINLEYPDPNDEGGYIEHAVPEQIKVQFNDERKLQHEVYVHE
jgi:adenylyl cyclase-associated protein